MRQKMPLYQAADKAGMSEKTARKYIRSGEVPGQDKKARYWRTRSNPFEGDWEKIEGVLGNNAGLEAKTIFEWLNREKPGRYQEGQLRTLQRQIKRWRCEKGPEKEVIFDQVHKPGILAQSDFTSMNELKVSIGGEAFEHLLFHFVLTYSNWETGRICYSESFESLSSGLQQALWELGGVPKKHQTDRLSAAVQKLDHPEEFTARYQALLNHYGLKGQKIQAGNAHENGDIEQSHHRLKRAVEQSLILRGSREFESIAAYEDFLGGIFAQLNAGRKERLAEELPVLSRLPANKLDQAKWEKKRVGPSSTIRIENNTYSVASRLIGEAVNVCIKSDELELWVGQTCIERLPRLRGRNKHNINYRHIIHSLVRKPGAFEQYRYKGSLFPSSWFRKVYDHLLRHQPSQANSQYLKILYLAATVSESRVEKAIKWLLDESEPINKENVEILLCDSLELPSADYVYIQDVELKAYDVLIGAAA